MNKYEVRVVFPQTISEQWVVVFCDSDIATCDTQRKAEQVAAALNAQATPPAKPAPTADERIAKVEKKMAAIQLTYKILEAIDNE